MIIALIADIHDNRHALTWALTEIAQSDATHVICLGDFVSPYTLTIIAKECTLPTFCVFGNNDGDRVRMARIADDAQNTLTLADREWGDYAVDGNVYFATHYPDLAELAAASGKYAAVFHGHTHHQRNETIGDIPIINPGKLAVFPINVAPSYALYDTQTCKTQFISMPL